MNTIAASRWQDVRQRGKSDPWLLGAFLFALLVFSALWEINWRHGLPFDIDEAGYTNLAIADLRGLQHHGIIGWIQAVDGPNIFSPITTALATPFLLVFGVHDVTMLLVPLALTLVGTALFFALARRSLGRPAAWAATILFASTPSVIDYSRAFLFVAAATTVMVAALYTLLRSNRLQSRPWSIAFGACVGLLPLARTETIAYIPSLVVAAAALGCLADQRRRAARNGIVATVCAALTAASWLAPNHNWLGVWDYLTRYGYGHAATSYGQSHSFLSYAAWHRTALSFLSEVYLPHFILFALGSLACLVMGVAALHRSGLAMTAKLIVRHPLMPALVVVVEGFAALSTTANQGTGFSVPLVPALCLLVAWAMHRIWSQRARRVVAVAGVVGCCGFIPALPWSWPASRQLSVTLPQLGQSVVTSGQGLAASTQFIDASSPSAAQRRLGQEWVTANEQLGQHIASEYPVPALAAFLFRNWWYNLNSVNLERDLAGLSAEPITSPEVEEIGATPADVRKWLTTSWRRYICIAFTAPGTVDEFTPYINQADAATLLSSQGFVRVGTIPLPDGQTMTEWHHPRVCPGGR